MFDWITVAPGEKGGGGPAPRRAAGSCHHGFGHPGAEQTEAFWGNKTKE